MSKFADFLREHQRLVILRVLSEMPAYRSNSSVLAQALTSYGLEASRDQVKTEIHWLGEQGLLTVEDLDSVLIVQLTERGSDVAAGRAKVPGIKPPGA
ncbi:MAG TPA: hypothetical protein DHW73_04180 [Pseudomonas sp.]|nr:hypothetical protein [Pseudomonadales bacterium]HCB41845.1 hypothetical protein [Pseudomonas sp.]HCL40555.1 hypothetical protein [Pseudomonas sp.]|tara:strand:- start:67 stop:360 length:294 start_codon:yes stop_codon:yes gene_type:complete